MKNLCMQGLHAVADQAHVFCMSTVSRQSVPELAVPHDVGGVAAASASAHLVQVQTAASDAPTGNALVATANLLDRIKAAAQAVAAHPAPTDTEHSEAAPHEWQSYAPVATDGNTEAVRKRPASAHVVRSRWVTRDAARNATLALKSFPHSAPLSLASLFLLASLQQPRVAHVARERSADAAHAAHAARLRGTSGFDGFTAQPPLRARSAAAAGRARSHSPPCSTNAADWLNAANDVVASDEQLRHRGDAATQLVNADGDTDLADLHTGRLKPRPQSAGGALHSHMAPAVDAAMRLGLWRSPDFQSWQAVARRDAGSGVRATVANPQKGFRRAPGCAASLLQASPSLMSLCLYFSVRA